MKLSSGEKALWIAMYVEAMTRGDRYAAAYRASHEVRQLRSVLQVVGEHSGTDSDVASDMRDVLGDSEPEVIIDAPEDDKTEVPFK